MIESIVQNFLLKKMTVPVLTEEPEEKPVEVEDVLVSPTSTTDITGNTNLSGKKTVYTMAIPKGDTHEWEGRTVEFWGKKWKVVGIPLEGIDELLPLKWNKKVTVERYE